MKSFDQAGRETLTDLERGEANVRAVGSEPHTSGVEVLTITLVVFQSQRRTGL